MHNLSFASFYVLKLSDLRLANGFVWQGRLRHACALENFHLNCDTPWLGRACHLCRYFANILFIVQDCEAPQIFPLVARYLVSRRHGNISVNGAGAAVETMYLLVCMGVSFDTFISVTGATNSSSWSYLPDRLVAEAVAAKPGCKDNLKQRKYTTFLLTHQPPHSAHITNCPPQAEQQTGTFDLLNDRKIKARVLTIYPRQSVHARRRSFNHYCPSAKSNISLIPSLHSCPMKNFLSAISETDCAGASLRGYKIGICLPLRCSSG